MATQKSVAGFLQHKRRQTTATNLSKLTELYFPQSPVFLEGHDCHVMSFYQGILEGHLTDFFGHLCPCLKSLKPKTRNLLL
jgi:hypothetical protein